MSGMIPSLARLNEGLRVRHIAASPLLKCSVSEDVEQASAKPTFDGIDQIPLFEGERIVAVWERGCKSKRKLDDSPLVLTDAPLWEFIHTVHEQPYRLVVQKTKIDGIVTWSDLLKVPVFVRVLPRSGRIVAS
jgi:predicted transcriptional regulator